MILSISDILSAVCRNEDQSWMRQKKCASQEEHKAEIASWKQKNLELVEKLKAKALQAAVLCFGRFVFFVQGFFGR